MMSNGWQCPQCNTVNRKPDYVLRLGQLSQSLGKVSIGTTSEPAPRCSQCNFEADVNVMLTGEYDHAGEAPPDQVIQVVKKEPTSKTTTTPSQSNRLVLVVIGLVVVLLCLCILVVTGIIWYLVQVKGM